MRLACNRASIDVLDMWTGGPRWLAAPWQEEAIIAERCLAGRPEELPEQSPVIVL